MSATTTGSASATPASAQRFSDIKAPLWDHVMILSKGDSSGGNVKWKCKYCPTSRTTSYTRVEAHLLQLSGKGITVCRNISVDLLSQMKKEVAEAKELAERSKEKTVSLPVSSSSVGVVNTDGKKRRSGPPSALEKAWKMESRKTMDCLIARGFYSGGVSFNFARNPYIREAFRYACSNDLAGYSMPGDKKISTTLLKQERAHIDMLLESSKSTWHEKGVTICADGWSDPQRRPLINFVAISGKSSMFLRADNCEGDVKTKEYIAAKLRSVIEEVGPKNVVQIITDNVANCKGAGLLIQAEYNTIFWTPCVVHTLNLAMKNICEPKPGRNDEDPQSFVFSTLEFISHVKFEAQMIKNFIMNHGMVLSIYKEFSSLKLLAIAETRFASLVCMLQRFVQVKRQLQAMVISEQWNQYKDDAAGVATHVREKILSEVWWSNVDFILKFTMPIYDMIRVADTDTPCLHLIYEMWDSMIEKVKKEIYLWEGKEEGEESDLFSVVYEILLARWKKGNNPLHCLAHSLNPRFYSKNWLDQSAGCVPPHRDNEVSKMRMDCFRKFFPIQEELTKVMDEYARFSTCSEEFNDHDSIRDRWLCEPMTWWSNYGQTVPLLQSLAIRLVSQPASSSCCERNWSTYSFIHSVKRNALTPERAEDLVYVHSNLRHLSRRTDAYKKGETRMWDVGGDAFKSMTGVGILEFAELSIDEPELQAVTFGNMEEFEEGEANPVQE